MGFPVVTVKTDSHNPRKVHVMQKHFLVQDDMQSSSDDG